MTLRNLNARIDELFGQSAWAEAGSLLEQEREKDPENHWVLTQLGVAYYEQRQYEQALRLFLTSKKIVPDCPLTLWNLAGCLAALKKYSDALSIYLWLLESKKSAPDDPCWESKKWTDALKADCIYRLGVCFEQQGKKQAAESCYRQHVNLFLAGIEGSYPLEEVVLRIRALCSSKQIRSECVLQEAIDATLHAAWRAERKGRMQASPQIKSAELFPEAADS